MKWLKLVGNLLGIGAGALERKSKLKELKAQNAQQILMAETKSKVKVIEAQTQRTISNDEADNRMDWEGQKQKSKSWKDDVLTYLILSPFASAVITPYIKAYKSQDWTQLVPDTSESFETLAKMPEFYMWALLLVIVDVLAFRRIAFSVFKDFKGTNLLSSVKNMFKSKK